MTSKTKPSPPPPAGNRRTAGAKRSWRERLGSWVLTAGLLVAAFVAVSTWQTRAHPAGGAAPAFELVDLTGQRHSLASLRGKTIQLHFWATWCGVCRQEFDALNAIHRGLEDDEVLLSVVRDSRDVERLKRFTTQHGIEYPVLRATPAVIEAYQVDAFPTNFFIDPEGRIAGSTVGLSSRWSMAARLGCAKR